LLATPASNATIFAGKALGAVFPATTLAMLNVIVYLVTIAVAFGPTALSLLPAGFTLLTLALLPGSSLLGAGLSSMVSARVNTEQVANQWSSLILAAVSVALFFVLFRVAAWGLWAFAAAVATFYALALAIILVSARTWRREEVMARRDA
jgi:hypothetical protein